MLLYMAFFFVIYFFAFANLLYDNIGKSRIVFVFITVFFFLFVGLRGAGYDYLSYEFLYNLFKNGGEKAVEPGFILLCEMLPNYRSLLIVIAFFSMIPSLWYLYKYSPLFFFSLLLLNTTFLLPTFMGQIRQGLAMAITFIAVFNISYWSKKYFVLLTILAALFHSSALLVLLILFIPKKIKSFKYYIFIILGAIIFSKASSLLLNYFFQLFPAGGLIRDKVFFYSETEDYVLGLNAAILIRLVVFFLCFWRKNKIKETFFPLLLNIYLYSIVIFLILGIVPQVGGRASLYFSFYELFLVPMILMTFTKCNRVIIGFCFILLALMRFLQFFMDDFNYSEYVPYLKYL